MVKRWLKLKLRVLPETAEAEASRSPCTRPSQYGVSVSTEHATARDVGGGRNGRIYPHSTYSL